MSRLNVPTLLACGAALALAAGSFAQAQYKTNPPVPNSIVMADPSTELLRNSTIKVTRGDYENQLLRLPEDARSGFGTNIDRVNALLRALLVEKTLELQAQKSGVDKDPEVKRRIESETARILAAAQMKHNLDQWTAEFNARPGLESAARERWLAQPERYRQQDEFQVTVIKWSTAKMTPEEARAKATDARARIVAGGDMAAIAKAESDDASAAAGGKLDWRNARALGEQRIARATAALKEKGDITRPMEGEDGVWIVRLDDRRPGVKREFDDVKAQIIGDMRREFIETQQQQLLRGIRDDPTVVVNQPAVEALVVRVAPNAAMPSIAPAAPGARGQGKGQSKGQGNKGNRTGAATPAAQ